MEEHLKGIKHLLILVVILLSAIVVCQLCLTIEVTVPPEVEAKSEEIMKVDLVKIGGRDVFLYDFIEKPY